MLTTEVHSGDRRAGAQGSTKGFESSVCDLIQDCICVSSIDVSICPTQRTPRNLMVWIRTSIHLSSIFNTDITTPINTYTLMHTSTHGIFHTRYHKYSYSCLQLSFTVFMVELEPKAVLKTLNPSSVTGRPVFVCQQLKQAQTPLNILPKT